ncbi:hypothetical protein C0992_000976 [Termitomyces sp. T32_za158]|nr:hypothetical protein C0992_000976 [Termitomyces sp. T32_za158]
MHQPAVTGAGQLWLRITTHLESRGENWVTDTLHPPTLLSNLVTHEKDYAKSLKSLQSPSHALSAYAAACAPPLSNALLQVSAALGGADEALARYADAVEECRDNLAGIEELEDDLSVVVRDRKILTSRRPAETLCTVTFLNSIHVPASSKLGAAQAELQACEATLAQKERALHHGRVEALRAGLGLRCRALMECGWVWTQVGKTALEALQDGETWTRATRRTRVTLHTTASVITIYVGDYVRQTPDAHPAPKRLPHALEPFYIPPAHANLSELETPRIRT